MNSFKAIFQNMSSWIQLLFLCIFAFSGLIAASFISLIIGILLNPNSSGDITNALAIAMQSINFIWLSQFITQILLFIVPAWMCAWLFNNNASQYLKTNRIPKLRILGVSILAIFTIQPIISFTGYYNSQMKLPESMAGIEKWMMQYEESMRLVMEQMLGHPSASALIINLFIIAIMAGISEELLFRGVLQQIFNRITSNYHVAIWVAAFIFSAIHMQFYGFIPRLLLGALLGYIFVWSGNLWVPIIAHAANNAVSILVFRTYHGTPEYDQIENFGGTDYWWLPISIILTGAILVYLRKQYNLSTQTKEYLE